MRVPAGWLLTKAQISTDWLIGRAKARRWIQLRELKLFHHQAVPEPAPRATPHSLPHPAAPDPAAPRVALQPDMLCAISIPSLPFLSLSSYRPSDSSNHCPVSIVGSCPQGGAHNRQDALQEMPSSYKVLRRSNTYASRRAEPSSSERCTTCA